jgi:hypothetical protein
MPVIPVNREVDKKRISGKMEVRGGGEAQGVAGTKKSLIFNQFKNKQEEAFALGLCEA